MPIPFGNWGPDQFPLNSAVAGEALGVLPKAQSYGPWPGLAATTGALRTTRPITGITKADPAVVTYTGTDEFANGEIVTIYNVGGMTEVNGIDFTVANVNTGANTFELSGIDSSAYTTYTSGGVVADVSSACRGAIKVRLTGGAYTIFAGSATKLYKFAASAAPTWTDVTRTSGGDYSLAADDFWSFTIFNNTLIACNGVDAPQSIDVNSGTAFAALAGSPPTAKYCQTVGDVVLLMNLTSAQGSVADSGEYQAMWCGFRDPTYWTLGKKSCGFATFWSGGGVQGCTPILAGLLFQQRGIQRMVQTTSSQLLAFAPIQEGQGTDSPYSIVTHEQTAFLYSTSGFIAVTAGGIQHIGNEWVDRWFLENSNQGRLGVIRGAVDPLKHRVFWLYPGATNDASTTLDQIICYDLHLNRWTHAEINATEIFSAVSPGQTLTDIAALYPTLEDIPYPFGSRVWLGGSPGLGAFDTDNKFALFAGNPVEAIVQTGNGQVIPGRRGYVSGWRPLTDAANATSRVASSERPQSNVEWKAPGNINAAGRVTRSASGRYFRFEVQIPEGEDWEHLQGVDFMADDLTEDGED